MPFFLPPAAAARRAPVSLTRQMLAKLSPICAARSGFYKPVTTPAELHMDEGVALQRSER